MDNLLQQAKTAYIVPGIKNSLLSVGELCDENLITFFAKNNVSICKTSINIALWQNEHETYKMDYGH